MAVDLLWANESDEDMSRKIVVATNLPQEAARPFWEGLADVEIRTIGPDLSRLDPDVECLIPLPASFVGPLIPPPVWPGGVRWVQLLSSGLDGYPDWLFDGVMVTTMHGVNAHAVAELALASILAAAKRIPEIWQESATWQQSPVGDLAGSTLGIVGFGAIGDAVAQRASVFGMTIQATRASDRPLPAHVRRAASIDALFATSDHVVLALPSSARTRGLVNASVLSHAKPGMHLVNVARGDLIDETALLTALDAGVIALASLDVLSSEPPAPDHPLLHHPRVRVSAHVGANTRGVAQAFARRVRSNLEAYSLNHPLQGQMDIANSSR